MKLAFGLAAAFWLGAVIVTAARQGDVRGLLVIGAFGGIVLAYRALLVRLRRRAVLSEPPKRGTFSDAELDRYSRHILLREIGGQGQRALKQARVLVVGAGGLGSPLLFYLAAAGVGRITVLDGDTVDNSNLQRQIIHTDARIGMNKAESAAVAMRALNPFVQVDAMPRNLGEGDAALVAAHDLILDGSDNFDTRYLVNRLAVQAKRPLIAAAITQWEGQIGLFAPETACYECVFPVRPAAGLAPSCAEAGVAAPLPGILGAMMAAEAIKHLTGARQGLANRLLIHDALWADSRVINVRRRKDCPICGEPEHRANG